MDTLQWLEIGAHVYGSMHQWTHAQPCIPDLLLCFMYKVPKSNFLSSDFQFCLCFQFMHLLPVHLNWFVALSQCNKGINEVATEWVNKKIVANQWFLCCTDSVRPTSSKEMATKGKKETWLKLKITKNQWYQPSWQICPRYLDSGAHHSRTLQYSLWQYNVKHLTS